MTLWAEGDPITPTNLNTRGNSPRVLNSQRVLNVSLTSVVSYVLPANTLATDGWALQVDCRARVTGIGTMSLKFGAKDISPSFNPSNSDVVQYTATIRRVSSGTQVCQATGIAHLAQYDVERAIANETLSSDVTLALRINGGGNVDHFTVSLVL